MGALNIYVLYKFIMTTLKIQTTLTKTFQNGTVSKWVFGPLSTGGYGAKCFGIKRPYKKVFTTPQELDNEINKLKGYGFTNPACTLVKQLSLAV